MRLFPFLAVPLLAQTPCADMARLPDVVGSVNTRGMTNAVNLAFRAAHETAVRARALRAAYQGRTPRLSHWERWSTGGRQRPCTP